MPTMNTPRIGRRAVLGAIAASPLLLHAADAAWPSRTVTIVVAYAPGGSTDLVARMLAQDMGAGLSQSVIVDNRGGGGTVVGTQYVRRAPADGYTLLFGTNAFVITSLLQKPAPWDPASDFEPVGMVTTQSLGVFVRPGLNIHSVQELIAYAKAKPGKLNFASSGNGSAQHLAGESFSDAAGIKMLHVPYKGAAPAFQDLAAGVVDVMFTSMFGLGDFIREKRVLLIATTGAQRTSATPDVPTVAESGLPDFKVETWQALFAPPNTPAPVVARLQSELVRIQKSGEFASKLKAQGIEFTLSTPAQLKAHVTRERDAYGRLLKNVSVQ